MKLLLRVSAVTAGLAALASIPASGTLAGGVKSAPALWGVGSSWASTTPTTTVTKAASPPPTTVAKAPSGIANGAPIGVAAGDYTLSVLVSAPATVSGAIFQVRAGSSAFERVVNFHSGPQAKTVTADVRVSGPKDAFWVITYGPATVGTLSVAPASFGYLVRGTTFTQPGGAAMTWHGVNSSTAIPEAALYSQTKANAVRISVIECQFLPYFHAYSATYHQGIADAIAAATAGGHTAIVNLMSACADDPNAPANPAQIVTVGPDMHSVDFWKEIATTYGSNSSVLFELFNEPKMNPTDIEPDGRTGVQAWRDGGLLTAGGATWSSPGMQALYNTVRAAGANNVVLVDGLGWASNLLPAGTNPIDGTNVAYTFHAYTTSHFAVCPATLNTLVAPVIDPAGKYQEAGIMTEFGTEQLGATGTAYLTSCLSWFAAHNVSWLVWGWYPVSWNNFGLLWSLPLTTTDRTGPVMAAF